MINFLHHDLRHAYAQPRASSSAGAAYPLTPASALEPTSEGRIATTCELSLEPEPPPVTPRATTMEFGVRTTVLVQQVKP